MQTEATSKELVAAGHQLAKILNSACPLLDLAKLVSDLATRLDCAVVRGNELQQKLDALAAEPVYQVEIHGGWADVSEADFQAAESKGEKVRITFTAPPVAALVLPESLIDEVCLTAAGIFGQSDPEKAQDIVNSIRKRLNATAPAAPEVE